MGTTIYLLEPGATSPPPRNVKTSLRARLLLISGMALFAGILIGGMVAGSEAIQVAWLAVAGKRITAHVTRIDATSPSTTTPAGSSQTPSTPRRYGLWYTFDQPFDGSRAPETRHAWIDIPDSFSTGGGSMASMTPSVNPSAPTSPPAAPAYKVGDAIVFRYARIGGRIVLHPWSPPPYAHMVMLGGIGLTLMAVGITFLLRLIRWHRRRMRLLRHGIGVTGSIVSKRVDGIEGKYYLTYNYLVRNEPNAREREEQCTPPQWKLFSEHDPVTLLYDPDKVDRVGLYRLLADV